MKDPISAQKDHHAPDETRYSRQILFPGIGVAGQKLLEQSRVAIVGVGATGAATASLLARAGVGRLTLIDRDVVEPSNLQRQVLFDERDAEDATPKAIAARGKIDLFNSAVKVEAQVADLVPGNISELLAGAQLILDCTDNYETRYLVNDYAVQQGVPWIYAGAVAAQAATMNILPKLESAKWQPTACLACLFPAPPTGAPETCDTAGILGSAVNLAASLQTTEALKFLTGQSDRMRRSFLSFDLWTNQQAEISSATPDPECSVCGKSSFIHLAGSNRPYITLCGRNSVQIHEHQRPISLAELHHRLATNTEVEDLRSNQLLLRFRRGLHQFTVFADGRALIQGTTDRSTARSLYARFIGN
jgi:adenylyltransferase/sulfurtransferase